MSDAPSIPQHLIVAAAALVDHEGRVLVQRRPAGGDFAGGWEFPGGKLEPEETPEDAVVRELREELGITVDRSSLAPAGFASEQAGGRRLLLLLFACRRWTGTPQPLHAAELRWLPPARMHEVDLLPADRPLVRFLEALLSRRTGERPS